MLELPLSSLKVGAANVRHATDIDENLSRLIASIRSVGLLQPLVVMKAEGGGFEIVAGRRRFAALNALNEEGHIHDTVPCIETDAATATEASLAENYAREQMKPTQLWRAFVTLLEQNPEYQDTDLARAFDLPIDKVRRTLRLGRVHPEIIDAVDNKTFRFDRADDVLQAFAATEDQDLQLQVYESIKGGGFVYAATIKKALGVRSDDLKLKVVTSEAYIEAGGRFERDLFATHDPNAGRVLDDDILDRLASEKLCGLIAELVAGDDSVKLSFAAPADQYGHADHNLIVRGEIALTDEQQKRVDEIMVRTGEIDDIIQGEADIPVIEGKDEDEVLDQLETERCALSDEYDEIHDKAPRAYPPGRKIAVPKIETRWNYDDADNRTSTEELVFTIYWADKQAKKDAEAAAAALAKAEGGSGLTMKQAENLATVKPELTQKASDTLAAMRKNLLKQACAETGDTDAPWRFIYVHANAAAMRFGANQGLKHLQTGDSIPLKELEVFKKDTSFADFMALPVERRQTIAALLMSSFIDNHPLVWKEPTFAQHHFGAKAQAEARRYWTPDADFFDMLKKQVILDMIAEIEPTYAASLKDAKVAKVKELALDYFLGKRYADGPVREQCLAFVPKWLRLAPPEPKAVKPKKAKAPKTPKAKKTTTEKVLEPAE